MFVLSTTNQNRNDLSVTCTDFNGSSDHISTHVSIQSLTQELAQFISYINHANQGFGQALLSIIVFAHGKAGLRMLFNSKVVKSNSNIIFLLLLPRVNLLQLGSLIKEGNNSTFKISNTVKT